MPGPDHHCARREWQPSKQFHGTQGTTRKKIAMTSLVQPVVLPLSWTFRRPICLTHETSRKDLQTSPNTLRTSVFEGMGTGFEGTLMKIISFCCLVAFGENLLNGSHQSLMDMGRSGFKRLVVCGLGRFFIRTKVHSTQAGSKSASGRDTFWLRLLSLGTTSR